MKQRYYIYDTLIAPNRADDTIRPIDLVRNFKNDQNAKDTLKEFIPQYIKSFNSPVRQVFNTVPRIRTIISVNSRNYDSVNFTVTFWSKAFVYAVILENADTTTLTSDQIINGYNENNTAVIKQHYKNVTTSNKGIVSITFNLLNDNAKYKIFVSA